MKVLYSAYEKLNLHKQKERDIYKQNYDKTHRDISFQVGELVMLHTPQTQVGMTTKFLPRWNGPYTITAIISPVNYRIESMCGRKNLVVHVQRMKRYRPWSKP